MIIVFGSMILIIAWVGPSVTRRVALNSAISDFERLLLRRPYNDYELDQPITCWGDSLTAGAGTTLGHDFPSLMTKLFHRPMINEGAGGESSGAIKGRFLNRTKPHGPETVIIWAGRNNFERPEDVKRDISEMIESLNAGSRFLVLGVINSDTPDETNNGASLDTIHKLNADLDRMYGDRFVPILEILLRKGNVRFAEDAAALSRGAIAASLRSDRVHLNDIGEAVVAFSAQDALERNGW